MREEGKKDNDKKIEEMVRNEDYIVGRIGIDNVELG